MACTVALFHIIVDRLSDNQIHRIMIYTKRKMLEKTITLPAWSWADSRYSRDIPESFCGISASHPLLPARSEDHGIPSTPVFYICSSYINNLSILFCILPQHIQYYRLFGFSWQLNLLFFILPERNQHIVCKFFSRQKRSRPSSGGLTSLPSGRRLVALFGSNFCSVETNISQIAHPSCMSVSLTARIISAFVCALR